MMEKHKKQRNQKDVLPVDNLRIAEDMKTDERCAEDSKTKNGTRIEADKKEGKRNMSKNVR